eukprot:1619756-Rhodomonas_salina.2
MLRPSQDALRSRPPCPPLWDWTRLNGKLHQNETDFTLFSKCMAVCMASVPAFMLGVRMSQPGMPNLARVMRRSCDDRQPPIAKSSTISHTVACGPSWRTR